MKSFSFQVKEEILNNIGTKQKAEAVLLGILLFCRRFQAANVNFVTENEAASSFFMVNLARILKSEQVVQLEIMPKKDASLFVHRIRDRVSIASLRNFYGVSDLSKPVPDYILKKPALLPAFTAGAFLACGSVNDPNKEYHFEFVVAEEALADAFATQLSERFEIPLRKTVRRGSTVLYLKESEFIEDMLTLMGATQSSLDLMNVKILKNVRNKINRAVNCDSANIEKTLRASERQLADIALIEAHGGFEALPEDLREIAELRAENPELNLKELGAALSTPISRSGANHRLERLARIAAEIRQRTGE
ncbi:MAG: DNA-binding protein WhiA [Oscillospiraceae bacterium]